MEDYHLLPKFRDSLSYLYIEHAVIEKKDNALMVLQETGKTAVPSANLNLLMLGPGTNITHAAVKLLAETGTSILWTGEDMLRFYAQGLGETHSARHILHQAKLVCDPGLRMQVVLRMYEKRFGNKLSSDLSLEQIRGMEGARMRMAYEQASRTYRVNWQGRNYDRSHWDWADPNNRALSAANALLNGICQAAIVSAGYSPGLGFLHTGLQLSFVYDIADLYKTEFSIPAAFESRGLDLVPIEKKTRELCRERFREGKLLERILPDIEALLGIKPEEACLADELPGKPSEWWTPDMSVFEEASYGRDDT